MNSAGVLQSGRITETDVTAVRQEIEVNLLGTMFATRAAMPGLREADLGHVVTVSSMNADYPPAGGSAYAASKAGVNNFSDTVGCTQLPANADPGRAFAGKQLQSTV